MKPLTLSFLLVCTSITAYCQNIIMSVVGKVVLQDKQKLIVLKRGDELKNVAYIQFLPDSKYPRPEIKMLTPKGIAVIKYVDYQSHPRSELAELISATIHTNSVANLGTRDIRINPNAAEQLKIVDSLCQRFGANPSTIEAVVSTYINPYCVAMFQRPEWIDIANMLSNKYGYKIYQAIGDNLTALEYNDVPKLAKVSTRSILPSAYSLKKYCPTPGDQGNFGTCAGWASAYGVRTISWAIRNNDTVTSDITNQAFSPTYVYEQIKQGVDPECQNGASIYKAVQLLKNKGVPYYSDLKYSCGINIDPFDSVARNYMIKDYYALTKNFGVPQDKSEFESNLTNIKRAISEKRPVLATIKCYKSFAGTTWDGVLDVNRGLHAVCIVGYDDRASEGGVVEIMNSWGPYWGNGGFIYVRYQDLRNVLTSAIALYDDTTPSPLKQGPEKPQNYVKPIPTTFNKYLEGSLSLSLKDGTEMPVKADENGWRGLKLASVETMNYQATTSYSSGTLFKIKFTSNQPAYVYIITTDSKKSPVTQLFPDPDTNTSALLDFTSNVSLAIPDGDQYIQMDENTGEDYLCIIYSKERLDISVVKDALNSNPNAGFVTTIKKSLNGHIADQNEIVFDKSKIAFKANLKEHTAVPIFMKLQHN